MSTGRMDTNIVGTLNVLIIACRVPIFWYERMPKLLKNGIGGVKVGRNPSAIKLMLNESEMIR